MISNLMNEPGETLGYTLAKHVNEVERYLGKHVLDYVIANNGEITEDMMYDFNQQIMLTYPKHNFYFCEVVVKSWHILCT